MKSKHTPGPWIYDDTWGLIVAGHPVVEVAACHAGRGADAKANAHIIAAAPEMLEALEDVRRFLETVDFETTEDEIAITAIVKSAIAKAKGEA